MKKLDTKTSAASLVKTILALKIHGQALSFWGVLALLAMAQKEAQALAQRSVEDGSLDAWAYLHDQSQLSNWALSVSEMPDALLPEGQQLDAGAQVLSDSLSLSFISSQTTLPTETIEQLFLKLDVALKDLAASEGQIYAQADTAQDSFRGEIESSATPATSTSNTPIDPSIAPPTAAGPLAGVAIAPLAAVAAGVGALASASGSASAAPTPELLTGNTDTNDVPVATAAAAAVDEDATITGSVSATDADAGETEGLTYALVLGEGEMAPVGLTFRADGSYSFDASSYDALAAGEKQVLTVAFKASDASSTSAAANLVITITGTNDAPISGDATTVTMAENLSQVGTFAATDVDIGDTLIYSLSGADAGKFEITQTGAVSFKTAPNYEVDPKKYIFNVVATDKGGLSATQLVSVAITDVAPPTITEPSDSPIFFTDINENSTSPVSSAFSFKDLYLPKATSVKAVYAGDIDAPDAQGVLSKSQAMGEIQLSLDTAMSLVNWSFEIDPGVERLGEDETLTQVFNISVFNGGGEPVDQEVFVTIHGVNDVPTIGDGTFSAQAQAMSASSELTATGSFVFSDADPRDQHTAVVKSVYSVLVDSEGNKRDIGQLISSFFPTIDAAKGELTWQFSVDKNDIGPLFVGQKILQTYRVEIEDTARATAVKDVEVTILGMDQMLG